MPAILEKILRLGEGRILKKLSAYAQQVNALEDGYLEFTDAELREETDVFRARLADGATSHSLPRSAQADQYGGAEACRECHARAFQVWSGTRHARAFASLQAQNNHFNPRCLPCHTVGYRASDGYVNPALTPALRDVQCEACHGRGGYHIRVSRGEKIPARRVVLRKADCVACHNTERSPGFDLETAWKKIEHREK